MKSQIFSSVLHKFFTAIAIVALALAALPMQSAQAAHTFGTSVRFAGTGNPLIQSYTVGSGGTLLVVSIVGATNVARAGGAPTYNGVALTQADVTRGAGVVGSETTTELWYLVSPPTGAAHNISIPNTGALNLYAIASSYSAQAGFTSAFDVANGNVGTTANPSVSVTTTANGDIIVGAMGNGNQNAPSADNGTTLFITDNGNYSDSGQYFLQTTAGAQALSWTVTANDWNVVVAAFKEVPATPTTTGIANVNVFEDAVNTSIDLWSSFADPQETDAQLTYTVTGNTNPGLFTSVTAPALGGQFLVLDYAPDANGTADITVRATDSSSLFVETTFTVTVSAVNDMPSFTKGADQTVLEDAGAQTVAGWATAINDGDPETAQTLTFNVTGNTNVGLFSVVPAIDATTGDLTYTPAANTNGSATITIALSDNGGTANGGVNTSTSRTFVINVTAVDDAPVAVNDSATVAEDAAATMINVLVNDTDVDGGPKVINSVTQPANGAVVIMNAGADLTYQPNADYCNGGVPTDDFTYTLNGGSTATVAVTVTCVNDAPVNSVPASQALTVNIALVFNTGNSNLISISDVDAGAGTLQVALTVTNGTITLSSTSGLSFIVGDGTGDTTMTFTGTLSDINNALNGLTFDPTTNYVGSASLQITTADQGFTGTGGSQTDSDIVDLTINGNAPTITSPLPSAGTVGVTYSHTFTATGSPAPTFSLTGSLPAGLSFDGVDTISGTPISGGVFGGLIVVATNGVVPDDTQNFSLTINAPTIALAPASLPNGTLTVAYNQTITASGGTSPHTFALTAGALPGGLTITSAGVLSGIPTAAGTFNFTVTATDSSTGTGPYTGSRAYSITVSNNTMVTIDQAFGQVDPTNSSPINFTVVFNETVTGFATGDVSFLGSTVGGTLTGTVTEIAPNDGTTYNVAVTGMTSNGIVVATIPAGVATGAVTTNDVSTSTDNTVTYDSVNPTVVSTDLTASYTGTGPGSFIATFSKAVDDPAGNTNTDDVTNSSNYLLVNKGTNGVANTATCAGGVVVDDTQVTVTSVVYNNVTFTATVTLAGPLPVGSYRLFICGTTSIVDLAGNPLNGGTDYTFDFVVQAAQQQGGGSNVSASQQTSLIPATGFPQNKITTLPIQPADKVYASTGLWLEIPKLGVKMSIVGVPKTKDGWDVTWLNKDAGWLNGSAYPTWNGNSVITAHVWDALNKPGPFAQLKSLKYGDQVKIHAFGMVYTYEITESTLITNTDVKTAFKHNDKSAITLITCEDYKELSNTYSYRRMVRAVLVSVALEK